MKITGIETIRFHSRHHNARRNWLLLKLLTDEPGLYGIGEASPLALDNEVDSVLHWWTENYLKGKDPLDSEVHWTAMHQGLLARTGRIVSTAISGIDIALWDLRGKILGVPVYTLLGGARAKRLRVYANGWYTNPGRPEQNAEEAAIVTGMGYTALKFDPFGQTNYFNISLEEAQLAEDRVAAVRESVGPNVDILVEAHAKFSVGTAIQLGKRLEKYRPMLYEEPVSYENVSEMKDVRDRVDIPIATGERLYGKHPFYNLIEAHAIDILQPDICNAGGITELKKIAAIAEAQHLSMAPHNTNSPVGTMASFHLDATMSNFAIQEYHAEFYDPNYFEVVDGLPRQQDGYIELPDSPGLGIGLNEDVLKKYPYVDMGARKQSGI
jgi:galactonate dehydratase